MGKLSTHVLDTVHGGPAPDVALELYSMDGAAPVLIMATRTNRDGRTDAPLLTDANVKRGRYRLVFHVGDHFRRAGLALPDPMFVDVVSVDFGIAEAGGNYHVPLVCSPWTYSTYRGS
jgi:5-hydroxyisourate hydrolase